MVVRAEFREILSRGHSLPSFGRRRPQRSQHIRSCPTLHLTSQSLVLLGSKIIQYIFAWMDAMHHLGILLCLYAMQRSEEQFYLPTISQTIISCSKRQNAPPSQESALHLRHM